VVHHPGRRGRVHHQYAHVVQYAFHEGTHSQSPVTLIIIFSRSRTGFRKTDTVLNRLIRGAIQTGLFTGIFSMADLITFVVLPNTNVYVMFAIPLGRIYTNVSVLSATYRPLTLFLSKDPLGYPPCA
jgi:hypothetical protein